MTTPTPSASLLCRVDIIIDNTTGLWAQSATFHPPANTPEDQEMCVAMVIATASVVLQNGLGYSKKEASEMMRRIVHDLPDNEAPFTMIRRGL